MGLAGCAGIKMYRMLATRNTRKDVVMDVIETICFHEWREAIDVNGVLIAMTCHGCGMWLSNDDGTCEPEE